MDKITTDILDTVEVGALATVNRDRTPLVTPLHFVRYKNDNIIWISDRQSRHAVNAYRSGVVEFVVWNDQKSAVFDYNGKRGARGRGGGSPGGVGQQTGRLYAPCRK